jgi:hypothetical protein
MGEERLDGNSSTRNFHICNARVRTMKGRRPDGWSRISNFHISSTRVRTKVDWRPDGDIWITILALRRHASGWNTTSSGWLIDLPFLGTWKESETGLVMRGVRMCCWNVRTDASWIEAFRYSGESGRKEHVVWTDGTVDRWTSGRDDTSSGQLTGNLNSSIFFAV